MTFYTPDGTSLLTVNVDDDSYHFQELMGSDELVLRFALTSHVEIPVGAYCIYPEQAGGRRYTVSTPESVTINHRRDFEYAVTLDGVSMDLRRHKLYNTVDGRLKFDYTARPSEHLALIIGNLNDRYGAGSWASDGCIDVAEKLISYNFNSLLDALNAIAETFETEWEVYTISGVNYIKVGKVEYNASNPLPLSYGKGNGFVSGVSRTNYDGNLPVGRVYIQGGERNIDYSKYPDASPDGQHSATLLLPRDIQFSFDGERFSDEYGYVAAKGVAMETDARGFSLKLGSAPSSANEDSLDISDIYPHRVGRITDLLFWDSRAREYVDEEDITDWSHIEYDVVDSLIPSDLNYEACLMDGEKMTLTFQTGMLVGREFGVKYHHSASGERPAKRFEIVRDTFDGQEMPSRYFLPEAGDGVDTGDQYAVFGIMLPSAYIMSKTADTQHTGKYVYKGAMYDALRTVAAFLYKNHNSKYTFRGELDGIWAKRNWANINTRIVVGGIVRFTDASVVGEETYYDLRIASVKKYINNPHSPTIELTDEEVYGGSGLSSELRRLGGEEVHSEQRHKDAIAFTRRSFRDAQETSGLLEAAFASTWGSTVNPISLHTMQLLAGDESLQIRFWEEPECTTPIATPVFVNAGTMTIQGLESYLQHMTLGVPDKNVLTTGKPYTSYHRWHMAEYSSAFSALEPDMAYYVYAKCEADGDLDDLLEGVYILSSAPLELETDGYYNFLVGILNSERDGARSYSSVYGYTEILPNQITTGRIRSADGLSFFDLEGNQFKLGNNTHGIQWNINDDGQLVIKGALNVSGSGEEFPAIIPTGAYASARTYYWGEEVTYNGKSYVYINDTPSSGHAPTDTTYWQLFVEGGGSDGVMYYIVPTVSAVHETASGQKDVSVVQCAAWKRVGSSAAVPATDGVLKYALDSGAEATYPTAGVSTYGMTAKITFTYRINNVAVDVKTVPLVKDGSAGSAGPQGPQGPQGNDGENAVSYYLITNVTMVHEDAAGQRDVNKITCAKYKKVGSASAAVTTEGTITYKIDSDTREYTYSDSTGIPTDWFDDHVTLFFKVSNVIVYNITILIQRDGQKGADGADGADGTITRYQWATTTLSSQTPSDWSNNYPNESQVIGHYVWQRQAVYVNNGWHVLDGSYEYPAGSGEKPNTIGIIHDPTASPQEQADRTLIAEKLGFASWEAFEQVIASNDVIIQNGFLNATLIETEALIARLLTTGMSGKRVLLTGDELIIYDDTSKPVMYFGGGKTYSSIANFVADATIAGRSISVTQSSTNSSRTVSFPVGGAGFVPCGTNAGVAVGNNTIAITDMCTIKAASTPTLFAYISSLSGISLTLSNFRVELYLTEVNSGNSVMVAWAEYTSLTANSSSTTKVIGTKSATLVNGAVLGVGTYRAEVRIQSTAIASYTLSEGVTKVANIYYGLAQNWSIQFDSINQKLEAFANGMGYRFNADNYMAVVAGGTSVEWGVQAKNGNAKYGIHVSSAGITGINGGNDYVNLMPIELCAYILTSGSSATISNQYSQTGNAISSVTRVSEGYYRVILSKSQANVNIPIIVTPTGSSSTATVMAHVYNRSVSQFYVVFRTSTSGGSSTVDPIGFSILMLAI